MPLFTTNSKQVHLIFRNHDSISFGGIKKLRLFTHHLNDSEDKEIPRLTDVADARNLKAVCQAHLRS